MTRDLPQVDIESGCQPSTIRVAGQAKEYRQGAIRSLSFRASDLKTGEGFSSIFGSEMKPDATIWGLGLLARDEFSVIGYGMPGNREFSIAIKPLEEADKALWWQVTVGWSPPDWELDTKATWWCEVSLPAMAFDHVRNAIQNGNANTIDFHARVNAWTSTGDYHAPIGMGIDWYLRPGKYSPDMAQGRAETFYWHHEPLIPVSPQLDVAPQTEGPAQPLPDHFSTFQIVDGLEKLRKSIDQTTYATASVFILMLLSMWLWHE